MGSEFFKKVEYGKETTGGTPVAGTRLFIGQAPAIKTDRKAVYPKENFGVRADAMRGVIHQYLYQNTLSTEHGCFEHIPFLWGGGVKAMTAGAETTVGQGDYPWTGTPSLTAGNAPDPFTIRMGDEVQAWVAEYCHIERIHLSGQVAQGADSSPVKIESDFFGRQLATSTFTAALAGPPLEPLNAKLARLYLDTAWAGVGVTELANALRSFDIQIITGMRPRFSGSAVKTFNNAGQGIIGVMGLFTVEGGAAANAILASQQAGSFVAAQLKINGGQIGSGVNHSLTLAFGGTYAEADPISGDDRGDNLASFSIQGFYDKTGAKLLTMAMVTDINAY